MKFEQIKKQLKKMHKKLCSNIAKIVLFAGYCIVVIPTAILMKIVRRDRLKLHSLKQKTYWKNFDNLNIDYERLF